MKIRLLIDAKLLGGTERHVISLCKQLSLDHHDCKIIFIRRYPDTILYQICDDLGVSYHACHTYRELFRLLKKDDPDIIHTHGYKANLLGRLLGLICKAKIIATFHAGEKPVGRLILYNFLDRWSSFFSYNIGVNALITAQIPSKAQQIPNFVTIPATPNTLKKIGPYNIFYVGRFSPEKAPLRFGQLSTLQLPSDNNLFQWHMIGEGPLLAECKKQYHDRIHFHGLIKDMDLMWPKVDLLCIPSSYEGLPLVLLEAMARGIPVVSFDIGVMKEVSTEKEYIITPFNLQQMRACISSHFMKTIEERQISSQRARDKIITTFSTEAIIPRIEAFYNECLR